MSDDNQIDYSGCSYMFRYMLPMYIESLPTNVTCRFDAEPDEADDLLKAKVLELAAIAEDSDGDVVLKNIAAAASTMAVICGDIVSTTNIAASDGIITASAVEDVLSIKSAFKHYDEVTLTTLVRAITAAANGDNPEVFFDNSVLDFSSEYGFHLISALVDITGLATFSKMVSSFIRTNLAPT